MAYGEPRLTNDIDIVAAVEYSHIPGLLAGFPAEQSISARDRSAKRYGVKKSLISFLQDRG
jgi:hypothetical protein